MIFKFSLKMVNVPLTLIVRNCMLLMTSCCLWVSYIQCSRRRIRRLNLLSSICRSLFQLSNYLLIMSSYATTAAGLCKGAFLLLIIIILDDNINILLRCSRFRLFLVEKRITYSWKTPLFARISGHVSLAFLS